MSDCNYVDKDVDLNEIIDALKLGNLTRINFVKLSRIVLLQNKLCINTIFIQQDRDNNYFVKVDDQTVEAYKACRAILESEEI